MRETTRRYGSDVETDAGLVQAARSGDSDALGAIYDRYVDRLFDFCTSVLRDPHEAADAVQDTFVAAARRLDQLRDPEKLRAWLFAIARHEALRRAKRRGRVRPVEDAGADVASADPAPEDVVTGGAETAAAVALVWDAAEGLAARDRALLDLHLRQGLDGQDLADAIGASPAQTYVLMSRLRDQVERSIGALLVARQGRRECEGLRRVLAEWDGTFTPLWRKRVARHVDGCEVCERRRRTVLGAFGAAPALAAPAALREPTLAAMRAARGPGAGGPRTDRAGWRRDGFPPRVSRDHRTRQRVGAGLLAAAVVVGTGAAVWELGADGRGGGAEEAGSGRIEAGTRTETTTTPTTVPATAPTTLPAAPDTTPAPAEPAGTSPGAPPVLPVVTSAPAPPPPPPDTTAPAIAGVVATPNTIKWSQGINCSPPNVSGVSASVTDDHGVSSVTLEWKAPGGSGLPSGSKPMSANGSTYGATVGPFASAQLPSVVVTITVVAADAAGNSARAETKITVTSC